MRYVFRLLRCTSASLLILFSSCDGGSSGGRSVGSSNAVPDTVVVSGTLVIDSEAADTAVDSTLVQTQEVAIQDSAENIVASGYTDEAGKFSVDVPGALAIDTGTGLLESGLTLVSLIEDDGQGKVLGVKEPLSISTSDLIGGEAKLGAFPFSEVAAIKGKVRFVNADGSENTKLQKVGTEVFLPGYSLFAKTDKDGQFLILYVPAGDYTLRVEKGNLANERAVSVLQNTTLNLGTIDVLSDTDAPITTPSKDSTDFKAPMCVTLTTSETGAKIYYSLDGSTPTATTPFLYNASSVGTCGATTNCPVCIQERSMTLKFFAVDAAGNAEDLQSKFYFFNEKWADPADTTVPGTSLYVDGQLTATSPTYAASAITVTLQANEGADIYYTSDGSVPTTASTLYNGPIELNATTTLRYFARDWASNLESVKTQTLRIYRWTRILASSSVSFDTGFGSPNSLVYDSNRSKVLLVTKSSSNFLTYEWDGSAWNLADTFTPAVGDSMSSAYYRTSTYFDSSKNLVMAVFGVCATATPGLRVHSYTPDASLDAASTNNWQSLTLGSLAEAPASGDCTSSPAISLGYTSGKHRAIVLGKGGTSGTNSLKSIVLQGTVGDSYSGSSWQAGTADIDNAFVGSLSNAGDGRVVYMPNLSKTIYFGGGSGSDAATYLLPDTEFDGSAPQWTKLPMAVFPHLLGADGLYLATLGKVLAFGGYDSSGNLPTNDAFLFDGSVWKKITFATETAPSPRRGASMIYIPGTEEVLLFGGISLGGNALTDTWKFSY